jgi:hypothetical protein
VFVPFFLFHPRKFCVHFLVLVPQVKITGSVVAIDVVDLTVWEDRHFKKEIYINLI